MKYYRIWHSLNEKEIGKYCQIKEGVYKFNINDDRFIGKVDYFLKPIPFSPLVPELTLWPKAKVEGLNC